MQSRPATLRFICSYLHSLRPPKSVVDAPTGKRAINLGRPCKRLLTVLSSFFITTATSTIVSAPIYTDP